MKSEKLGKHTLDAEVTNVSAHGFWLLLRDREFFVSFEHFPWFKDVPIGKLLRVELPQPHHLYWPDLDIDLAVESLDHPERFPLVSRVQPARLHRRTSRRRPLARSSAR